MVLRMERHLDGFLFSIFRFVVDKMKLQVLNTIVKNQRSYPNVMACILFLTERKTKKYHDR